MSQKLTPDRFKSAEYVRQIHSVTIPEGTTLEEVQEPAYWAHVAGRMHPRDRIEAWAEDGAWYAEFMIISCSRNYASVAVLLVRTFQDAVNADAENCELYKAMFKGPVRKWAVIRTQDKEIMKDGFDSRGDAEKSAAEFQRTQLA